MNLVPPHHPRTPQKKTHELKCWPEFFNLILRAKKKFDVRLNDRDFQTGDEIRFREWNPDSAEYTGRSVLARIDYIMDALDFQRLNIIPVPNDLVILSISLIP